MRAKSGILLILALGCGLVAAVGVYQVVGKPPEPTDQKGDIRSIVVAAKDLAPGELITPQMVKLESWPKGKAPEDSLGEIAKVEGCRARDEIYQGEPIRERKLLGQGFTRRTATDYIPKGYRVVGVKVDIVSGGAGLIQPGDRVDVLVNLVRDPNRGVTENRTQTILQDIKVFAVDDVFKIDPGADERDSVQAKVIQLLVTPHQAESLVLAQQLGRVQLTMRPPSGEDIIQTPGKTPAELLGHTSAGDRGQEGNTNSASGAAGSGSLLDFLNGMKTKPAAAAQPDQTAAKNQSNSWSMRVLSGSEMSDVVMEESVDASGEHVWRVGTAASEPQPEPPAAEPPSAPQPPAPQPPATGPSSSRDAAPAPTPAPAPPQSVQSTRSGQSDAADADAEQPKE